MKLASIPPEDLFFRSTLVSLFNGPSPSPLRRLLPFLLPISLLFYLFVNSGFTYSTPNSAFVPFSIFRWLVILPITIAFNRYVTLPFLVDQNVLQPSPSQGWFEARTLSSMAECLGFAMGGEFLLVGCFGLDKFSNGFGKFCAFSIPVWIAALVLATYQRRITWESMKLKGYERPAGLY